MTPDATAGGGPVAWADAVLAHGVGSRSDLPVPVWLAVTGGACAVVVSFAALGLLWPEPRLRADAGRPLPVAVQAAVDHPVTTGVLRAVVLVATAVVVAVALAGPALPEANLGVYGFYVTFWVGLVPVSLLLGPVWRRVNPLRTLHALLARLTGPAPGADRLDRVGSWPAAAALLLYSWLELAHPGRSQPSTVGLFLVSYGVVQLLAGLWFGPGWFARGDGFEVYSTLLGRLAPIGRRSDGRLVLRNPLSGAEGTPPVPGLTAVVVVLVGGTAFDGITRTRWWQDGPGLAGDGAGLFATLGLLDTVGVVAALYVVATALSARISGAAGGPAAYAHSLIPIAAGYAIAHYFSLLLLDGQRTWRLASDPFQTGLDLFGTAGNLIDYTAVSPRMISLVQVGAIVLGHVLGVVLAHDRAVRVASPGRTLLAQFPLLVVMVAFTVGGLGLLLG
ncbi:hypothetical protein [Modestobacter sp. I12A-02662]|uniref:hypothetical protein n=1 Tax=Modestobacter sp. I12A-02662 TaxID=1730496 RepID=UPI0034DFE58A